MTRLSESVRENSSDLLEKVRNHALLTSITEDRLSDARLRFLLGQVFLFGREYERFLSSLIARTPQEIRRSFVESMMDFYWDSDVFEEMIRRVGVDPSRQLMSPPCQSFVNFLFTAVTVQTFPEAICAGYGAAESAREFWTRVKQAQPTRFGWGDFVEMWSGDVLNNWISATAKAVDGLADICPPPLQERMLESYRLAVHYQIRFLDLALESGIS